MKKRILIGIFSSLFLIVIGLIIVYYSATSSIKKGEEVAVERAKK